MRTFNPNLGLSQSVIQSTCSEFSEAVKKTSQLVFSCSNAHWTTTAVNWPHATCKDSIIRIRADVSRCVAQFGCKTATEFILTNDAITAQDDVDILQLKGSLMDYQTNLRTQMMTPQVQHVVKLIDDRIRSIGHLDGLQDGPGVSTIPPFLPPELDLELSHTEFTLGERIGNGTFGSVYIGTMTHSMKKVAIKVLHMKVLGGRQLETFKREVWALATVNHPAVLRLVGVTLTPPFCIITELLKCSLFDRMRFLTPTKKSVVALHIALGMEQLHASRIIHRDLKSANILLDEDDLPRVCDFGLVGFKKKGTHTGFVGTAQWMAPEMLRSSPFYDEKVDVYSFAVLLWELLTLQEPYKGVPQDQVILGVIERGVRPPLPSHYGPPGLVALIQTCWAEDPADRPSFDKIAAALRTPECHFIGTMEDEFARYVPKQRLAEQIVHAVNAHDWRTLDQILASVHPGSSTEEPELMTTIMQLFDKLDSERQRVVVCLLPQMVNFESFLSTTGYTFVVSLLTRTETVVDETINVLRTVDISSVAFRQKRLIESLCNSCNVNAHAFLSELCACSDIASFVLQNYIPLSFKSNYASSALKIYGSLLMHVEGRSVLATVADPLDLAINHVMELPLESSVVFALYPVAEHHVGALVASQIIPKLTKLSETEYKALSALHHLFVLMPTQSLAQYTTIINVLLQRHPEFYQNQSLIQKLATIDGVVVQSVAPQVSLIDF